jgi:translation initiation factor RLI1
MVIKKWMISELSNMKNLITEEMVKKILEDVLLEEISKVSRFEFNRVQFKIDEVENALKDTKRELIKLENSIPKGLKSISNGKLSSISSDIIKIQKTLQQFSDKVKSYKKSTFTTKIEEKKSI